MTRDEIIAVLESCCTMCLDTEQERAIVADRLRIALHASPASTAVRQALAGNSTVEGRTADLIGHPKRLAYLISAAARLAGCDESSEAST